MNLPRLMIGSSYVQQINPESMEDLIGSELPVKFLDVDEVSMGGRSRAHAGHQPYGYRPLMPTLLTALYLPR